MKLTPQIADLIGFIQDYRPLFVLTGAGISSASGLPTYRDANGDWKHSKPIQWRDFLQHVETRQRYWARSMIGWPRFAAARPNSTHYAINQLERRGILNNLVTQNVDGLHQQAGSQRVIDLHGRLDRVVCLDCHRPLARDALQPWLENQNPQFLSLGGTAGPDGDARIDEQRDLDEFAVPSCSHCSGLLKPDVVFFGDNVPRQRVDLALRQLGAANAILVVGSSLMVYSGYRFSQAAKALGKPAAAISLGRTRADPELDLKIIADCGEALTQVLTGLTD